MVINAHRTLRQTLLLFLLLFLSLGAAAQASRDTLRNGDTVYINNCRFTNGSIVIDTAWFSLMQNDPTLGLDAWVVLDLNDVMTVLISHGYEVTVHTEVASEVEREVDDIDKWIVIEFGEVE